MRANVNLLTAASQASVEATISGYENAVAAHISGDWSKHNQFLFYATPFAEFSSGNTIPNCFLLRVLLTGTNTDGTGDAAFTLPVIVTGETTASGGAPIIIRQPVSITVVAGQNATFTVRAISGVPVTYEWLKNGTNISDSTTETLVLVNVQATAQATYSVQVTNTFGSATSTGAVLTVT